MVRDSVGVWFRVCPCVCVGARKHSVQVCVGARACVCVPSSYCYGYLPPLGASSSLVAGIDLRACWARGPAWLATSPHWGQVVTRS